MSKRLISALSLGVACALVGGVFLGIPWGWGREEATGLYWLFHARGARSVPPEVMVVAIDRESSERLQVPYETTQWPRSLHARLVDDLHRAGVRMVAFDLLFLEDKGANDTALIASLEAAGNVLLLEFLEKREVDVGGAVADRLNAALHRRVPPAPRLSAAAAASAPFTLPKVPLRVAQFWTFDRNAGDAASLPLLGLLVYAVRDYDRLRDAIVDLAPELAAQLPGSAEDLAASRGYAQLTEHLAGALRRRPGLAGAILSGIAARSGQVVTRHSEATLAAVLAALADPPSRYLNYYGPPLSVPTMPYHAALRELEAGDLAEDWRERAVFVGLSSPVQWEQRDEFITAFSDPDTGHDLSGIEILATAFANLLERSSLQPLPPGYAVLLVVAWGLAVGLSFRMLTPPWAALGALILGVSYFIGALRLFSEWNVVLPVLTPLAVQLPFALFLATGLHYRAAKRDRLRIRELFRYYLPEPVVERLVREGFHPMQDRETVFGVCLHSDAAKYTTLSEAMDPNSLASFMNAYYDLIFEPVRRHQGIVSDVIGDAMMAIWAARSDDLAIRTAACHAALEIIEAVRLRNCSGDGPVLATRIGLHCGAMALAHVGARDHFEYRAVGDIVNTASRLQELNKQLGTSILASADTLHGVAQAVTRPCGSFILTGKSSPVEVYELLGWQGDTGTGG